MSEGTGATARNAWKLIPGFAISGYFLWSTLRSIKLERLHSLRVVHPWWLAGVVLGVVASYTLRPYRWWCMMRGNRARFGACYRVLLTSLAANNILPFRIGDFMRIFAYAGDVNAPSSTVLSTVLLERLLDVFMLLLLLVVILAGAGVALAPVAVHGHHFGVLPVACAVMVPVGIGLGLLLFGTHLLDRMVQWVVGRFGTHPKAKKLSEWMSLLFDAVLRLSLGERLWLLAVTATVWVCEGMIFLSTARALGMVVNARGPWLATTLSNLSFLLPSAPGGIGPFEASAKLAMQTQGLDAASAAVYALLAHLITFFWTTGVGGVAFLIHRKERGAASRPMSDDLVALTKDIEAMEPL